jgi:hypothetical protein
MDLEKALMIGQALECLSYKLLSAQECLPLKEEKS